LLLLNRRLLPLLLPRKQAWYPLFTTTTTISTIRAV
jgi:hypothetical protein